MRKPISKNSLRRAMDRAIEEGYVECSVPVNTVVDRIWHEMERENYNAGRKRTASRASVRTAIPADNPAEMELIEN